MNHSIFVNHTFLVSVTLTNGSRSLLKSSVNIRNDILLACTFYHSNKFEFLFCRMTLKWVQLRWGSIKVNEYIFIKWSKPFALSTYFFASMIMGHFRNSIGHHIPYWINFYLLHLHTDILGFLQMPFQATEVSEIQILVIIPRLSPLLKLPVHFWRFNST